jgi:nicotinamidase-related amidase
MSDLVGQFLLEQLYCPSCGALLNTDLVEDQSGETELKRETPGEVEPKRLQPRTLSLEAKSTAVIVLDLTNRSSEMFPEQAWSQLLVNLGVFLETVRPTGITVVYTGSAKTKGTSLGDTAPPLRRRPSEAVIYPDSYDKFFGGELKRLLDERGVKNIIFIGAATNVAVLYTATSAARVYRYNVVIPTDGVLAAGDYEQEYALHQLSSLPGGVAEQIQFTTLSGITLC